MPTRHEDGQRVMQGSNESDRLNVRRLFAFWAACHFELNALIFLQGFEAVALNRGKVCEQIFATFVRSDETKTFCIIEPLDCTSCHCISYLSN